MSARVFSGQRRLSHDSRGYLYVQAQKIELAERPVSIVPKLRHRGRGHSARRWREREGGRVHPANGAMCVWVLREELWLVVAKGEDGLLVSFGTQICRLLICFSCTGRAGPRPMTRLQEDSVCDANTKDTAA